MEEIALEIEDYEERMKQFQEAEKLHLDALAICQRSFGDRNVQTAKRKIFFLFQKFVGFSKNFYQNENE